MQRPRLDAHPVLALSLVALLAACAPTEPELALDATEPVAVPEHQTVPLERSEPAPDAHPDPSIYPEIEDAREEGLEPDPEPIEPTDLTIRDDGRPSWWFSGVRLDDRRVALCAEALGADLRRTRAAAIDAGRARLRDHLELPPDRPLQGVEIHQAWVWPLPNASARANRYAGYVLISAARHD